MSVIEICAFAPPTIIITGLVWYIILVGKRRIETVVASWIVSTAALTLSLITYFSSPNANWVGGSFNAASVVATAITLLAVYRRSRIDHQKIIFNPFQKKCLIASLFITVLWIWIKWGMHGTGVIPNLLTQALLVISYAMLIVKFWNAERNTESLFTWLCIFLSSAIALYPSWKKKDWLAFIYAFRSTVMCGILVYTLCRIKFKNSNCLGSKSLNF